MARPAVLVDGGRPSIPRWRRLAATALVAAAGLAQAAACGDDTRVRLVPVVAVAGSRCGRPLDAVTVKVTALGDFRSLATTLALGETGSLDGLPDDTRQLGVEVLDRHGAVETVGKTLPFELSALAGGAELRVMMAPLDGYCRVGDLSTARIAPLVMRAGDGALVLGGQGDSGAVKTAEYYDPLTGQFTDVSPVPLAWHGEHGFTGAAATALPDGKVLISGGASASYAVFDPDRRAFGPTGSLVQARAFHVAIALDSDRVLIGGGCAMSSAGTPACTLLDSDRTALILTLSTSGLDDAGPHVAGPRLGGTAILESAGDATAPAQIVIAGGVDAAGNPVPFAERIASDGGAGQRIAVGGGTAAIGLDGGASLLALATGNAPSGAAQVIVPGVDQARVVASTAPRGGVTLTLLEDGSALALGGADAARYRPETRSWRIDVPAGGPILAGHGAVRLGDGSVLVVGGRDGGMPLASAYVYRPSLTGPFTGAVTHSPDDDPRGRIPDNALSPLDPARFDTGAGWRLTGTASGLGPWAVVTGPRILDGSIDATVRAGGGVAVLLGFRDPSHFDAVEVPIAAPPRLVRRRPGGTETLCEARDVATLGEVTVSVRRRGTRVTATVTPKGQSSGGEVLGCDGLAPERGPWGLAPLGASTLDIDVVTVQR